MASLFARPINYAWLGFALAIVTTAFMVMTYAAVSGAPPEPEGQSDRGWGGCMGFVLFMFLGLPSFVFTLISCSLGLVSLVGSLREQRNLFAPIATMVLSVFCFILFGLM